MSEDEEPLGQEEQKNIDEEMKRKRQMKKNKRPTISDEPLLNSELLADNENNNINRQEQSGDLSEKFEKFKEKIQTLYFFKYLTPFELNEVLSSFQTETFNEGDTIFKQGAKADKLFFIEKGEITCWKTLPETKRSILTSLLKDMPEFAGFLRMVGAESDDSHLKELIKSSYEGRICLHADLEMLISQYPCELAYALVLVDTTDHRSITPGWVLCRYPKVEYVIDLLRHTPCSEGCPYCNGMLDVHRALKKFFGYDEFRKFEGENLQEMAVRSAVCQDSLLAIFPT